MPPYPIDLFYFWNETPAAQRLLHELADKYSLGLNPKDCGYAQAIQSRLRSFDNNKEISDMIKEALPGLSAANHGIDYFSNPRKNLLETARSIFVDSNLGSVDFDRVMEGLTFLDVMERQRIVLTDETRQRISQQAVGESTVRLFEELHNAAVLHYEQFYKGFRACVSEILLLCSFVCLHDLGSCPRLVSRQREHENSRRHSRPFKCHVPS